MLWSLSAVIIAPSINPRTYRARSLAVSIAGPGNGGCDSHAQHREILFCQAIWPYTYASSGVLRHVSLDVFRSDECGEHAAYCDQDMSNVR